MMLVGSDDGVRVWINDALVHSNPAYRGAYPDQDRIKVSLRKGWNKVMIKVLQGAGGWGYYVRFADPDGKFGWTTEKKYQEDEVAASPAQGGSTDDMEARVIARRLKSRSDVDHEQFLPAKP